MNHEHEPDIQRKLETNTLSQNRLPADIARRRHIEQFWSPNMDYVEFPGRYPVIDLIAALPGVNKEALRTLSREIGRLAYELAAVGNLEAAHQIVMEPYLLGAYRSLVTKVVAQEIKTMRPDATTQKGEITLWCLSKSQLVRSELEAELALLNADETTWTANWNQELRQLRLS